VVNITVPEASENARTVYKKLGPFRQKITQYSFKLVELPPVKLSDGSLYTG
jgi:hypothetical protein